MDRVIGRLHVSINNGTVTKLDWIGAHQRQEEKDMCFSESENYNGHSLLN